MLPVQAGKNQRTIFEFNMALRKRSTSKVLEMRGRGDHKMLMCDICKTEQPRTAYSASVLNNIAHQDRIVRCLECSNPPCMFFPNCTTCPKCRRHNSKGGRVCLKTIQILPTNQLPKSKTEVGNFTCDKMCIYTLHCAKNRRHTVWKKTSSQCDS